MGTFYFDVDGTYTYVYKYMLKGDVRSYILFDGKCFIWNCDNAAVSFMALNIISCCWNNVFFSIPK